MHVRRRRAHTGTAKTGKTAFPAWIAGQHSVPPALGCERNRRDYLLGMRTVEPCRASMRTDANRSETAQSVNSHRIVWVPNPHRNRKDYARSDSRRPVKRPVGPDELGKQASQQFQVTAATFVLIRSCRRCKSLSSNAIHQSLARIRSTNPLQMAPMDQIARLFETRALYCRQQPLHDKQS